jgi:hypothetical protein
LQQQEPFATARAICNSKSHLQQQEPCEGLIVIYITLKQLKSQERILEGTWESKTPENT